MTRLMASVNLASQAASSAVAGDAAQAVPLADPVVEPAAGGAAGNVNQAEECILILSPWGRDGEVMRTALERHGFACDLVPSFEVLDGRIRAGAGAALITEEAL